MQTTESGRVALDPEDLRDIDRDLLDYLHEGRITPAYGRDRMVDEGIREVTSTYVGQRLQRLEEHGHARNLYNTELYELVDDPREDGEE